MNRLREQGNFQTYDCPLQAFLMVGYESRRSEEAFQHRKRSPVPGLDLVQGRRFIYFHTARRIHKYVPGRRIQNTSVREGCFVISDLPGSRSTSSGINFPVHRSLDREVPKRTWRKPETCPNREKSERRVRDDRLTIGNQGQGDKRYGFKRINRTLRSGLL